MARKTKEEARKTRTGILNAALDTICEKGYSATNLNDIAKKLGMTRGVVYWHFRNKEELFYSLIVEIDKEVNAIIGDRAQNVRTLKDLHLFLVSLAEMYVSNERMFKYLVVLSIKIEWNDELKRVVKLFKKQSQELEEFFLYVFRRVDKDGGLRSRINKKLAAKSLTALIDGCLFGVIPQFGKRDTDVIKNALEIFFQGLKNQ